MILTKILEDGRTYTWSDSGYKIRQDTGVLYDDAIDSVPHTYTETDILIDGESSAEEIVDILTGVTE